MDPARTEPEVTSSARERRVVVATCGGGSNLAGELGGCQTAGLPVRVPTSVETTATGAAILAAVGAGVHASVAEAVAAFVDYQPDEHVPDPERHQLYTSAYHRYRELYYALKPVFEKVET